jgi:hypothetical protein
MLIVVKVGRGTDETKKLKQKTVMCACLQVKEWWAALQASAASHMALLMPLVSTLQFSLL